MHTANYLFHTRQPLLELSRNNVDSVHVSRIGRIADPIRLKLNDFFNHFIPNGSVLVVKILFVVGVLGEHFIQVSVRLPVDEIGVVQPSVMSVGVQVRRYVSDTE